MKEWFKKNLFYIFLALVLTGYLTIHLLGLTQLPVFADEAIYIRWSQLIIDQGSDYLFFPLNDGKTPLYFWLLVPFQLLKIDPLLSARLLSVIIGFFQLIVMGLIINRLQGSRRAILLVMLLTAILPFWYFHHRIALIEALLNLTLSLTLLGVISIVNTNIKNFQTFSDLFKNISDKYLLILVTGFAFGLALWTKLPAVLALPGFMLLLFLPPKITLQKIMAHSLMMFFILFLGSLIFLALKLHPAFSQLFTRGSDFLYPLRDVLLDGVWKTTIFNTGNYIHYFLSYLTPALFMLIIVGLFGQLNKRKIHLLFWAGIVFMIPIILMGKVVYPRYFFPAAIFFTLSGALSIDSLVAWLQNMQMSWSKRLIMTVLLAVILTNIFSASWGFIQPSMTNADEVPFVAADKVQYLTEWSSGHGILETTRYIQESSKSDSIAVATEGYFGTLPDGMLMYLHQQDVSNIYVEGIGQPVSSIPETFKQRAMNFERVWLVVNSHRLELGIDQQYLLQEYCRPNNAPCLQLWDISHLLY